MDNAWIGLVGVVGGVLITNAAEIVKAHIVNKRTDSQRWLEDKKRAYSQFVLYADIYFRNFMSFFAQFSRPTKAINDARDQLNDALASIQVMSDENIVKAADDLNKWMAATFKTLDGAHTKLSTEDTEKYIARFDRKKGIFLRLAKEDIKS